MKIQNYMGICIYLCLTLSLNSCFSPPKKDESTTAPAPSVFNSGTGKDTLSTTNVSSMKIIETTTDPTGRYSSHHHIHLSGQGHKDTKCEIPKENLINGTTVTTISTPSGSNIGNDILCWLDTEELELRFFGMTLHAQIPKDVCEYLQYQSFYFWQYRPIQTTAASISNVVTPGCQDCNGGSGNCPVDNSTTFTCASDYSKNIPPGPNCDEGSYTLRTYSPIDPTNAADACASSSQTVACGGKITNCLNGPGTKIAKDGYPISTILLARDGISDLPLTYAPLLYDYSSNRYLANYTMMCPSVDNYSTDTLWLYKRSNNSTTLDPLKAAYNIPIQPFYEFRCLNRAREVLGRIRIQVRSWNKLILDDSASNMELANPTNLEANGSEGIDPSLGLINDWVSWDNKNNDVTLYLSNSSDVDCTDHTAGGYTFPGGSL